MSSWKDHLLPCLPCLNLSGDHLSTHTFTHPLPHLSTTWIIHNETVGSEIMSQLLREPGETDTRVVWWLYHAVPLLRLFSAPDVQGLGWWIMGYTLLLLLCSVTRIGGKIVWFGPCAYVCVFVQGKRTVYTRAEERLVFAFPLPLTFFSIWIWEKNTPWFTCGKIESASECAWGGVYTYETCLWKQI